MEKLEEVVLKAYQAKVLDGEDMPFTVIRQASNGTSAVIASVGWTLHFTLLSALRRSDCHASDLRLYGDEDRFNEDIILAKMQLP